MHSKHLENDRNGDLLFAVPAEFTFSFPFLFQNGVRGLMLDAYDFNNDIWLCHGQCKDFTAFVSVHAIFKNHVLESGNHAQSTSIPKYALIISTYIPKYMFFLFDVINWLQVYIINFQTIN